MWGLTTSAECIIDANYLEWTHPKSNNWLCGQSASSGHALQFPIMHYSWSVACQERLVAWPGWQTLFISDVTTSRTGLGGEKIHRSAKHCDKEQRASYEPPPPRFMLLSNAFPPSLDFMKSKNCATTSGRQKHLMELYVKCSPTTICLKINLH